MPSGSPGWFLVMNHAKLAGWQWGVDLVFTSGPLSFLFTRLYHPQLWWTSIAVWSLLALLFAAALVRASRAAPPIPRVLVLGAAGAALSTTATSNVVFLLLPLLALTRLDFEVAPAARGRSFGFASAASSVSIPV